MKLIKNFSQQIVFIILILTFGTIPLLFYPRMMWSYHSPKELFLQFAMLLAIGCHLIYYINADNIKFRFNYLDILLTLRPVILFILFLNLEQYYTLPINIYILLYLTIFYWLGQLSLTNNPSIEKAISYFKTFLWILLVVCTVESIYGLAQYWHIVPFQERMVYKTVIVGTIGNTNGVGGFFAAGLPLLLGLFYFCDTKTQRVSTSVGIMLCLAILILTRSRGAWLALIFGLASYFFPIFVKAWKRIKKMFFRAIVIVTIIVLLLLLLFFLYSINKPSSLGRIFIWKVTMQMINDFPIFGIGYGNFPITYLDYQSKFFENPENNIYLDHAANIKQAHNEYLQVLAETGIFGFVLFICILISFYRICYHLILSKNDTIKQIGRMLIASTTVILVHSLFDNPLHVLPIYLIFFFNLSVASALSKRISISTNQADKNIIPITKTFYFKSQYRFIYVVLVIAFFIIGIWKSSIIIQEVKGYILWKKGMEYTQSENWEYGIQYYKKALQYLHHKGELHFHLGGAYVMNKQYKLALPEFEKARLTFNDKNISLSEGMAFQGLKDYESAEKSFRKAISMQPNLLFPQFLLGSMYYESNQTQKAIPILQNIISSNPKIQNQNTKVIRKAARNLLDSMDDKISIIQ